VEKQELWKHWLTWQTRWTGNRQTEHRHKYPWDNWEDGQHLEGGEDKHEDRWNRSGCDNNDKAKTGLDIFAKFRLFTQYFVEDPLVVITASSLLGYDATSLAHLYLGSFSHSYLQILSSSVRLDGERRCTAFSGLSRDVRSGSSPGSGWCQSRLVPKPLLSCLGCVLRVIVLLECEPSPQSEVLSAMEQVVIKDHCPFISPSPW
jgi:hypothetical protein